MAVNHQVAGSSPADGAIIKMSNNFLYDNNLPEGYWLVNVHKGGISYKPIKPDYPEVSAALDRFEEEMVKIMSKKAELRPSCTNISKKEKEAWEQFEKTMGKDMPNRFEFASFQEICKSASEIIHKEVSKEKKKLKRLQKYTPENSIEELEV